MTNLERRIGRAKEAAKARSVVEHSEGEREEERKRVRQSAEHANRCRGLYQPIFRIGEDGRVFSAKDGKPITALNQTLSEQWYWEYLSDFAPPFPRGLIHDPQKEAFYKPEPPHEMVFSREVCYVNRFFWATGSGRAHVSPRDPLPGPSLSPERAAELRGGRG